MRKFFDFLFSMQFAGTLMLIFAAVIGAATFVENDLGTLAARIIVYDSRWFEGLMLLMSISMFGSIFKYKLYQRKKHTVLIFHISFIIILIGAAITRYVGEEGTMRIREGEASNQIISQESYILVSVNNGINKYNYSDKKLLIRTEKIILTKRSILIMNRLILILLGIYLMQLKPLWRIQMENQLFQW